MAGDVDLNALRDAWFDAVSEQTGGFTMVATVYLKGDHTDAITITNDGGSDGEPNDYWVGRLTLDGVDGDPINPDDDCIGRNIGTEAEVVAIVAKTFDALMFDTAIETKGDVIDFYWAAKARLADGLHPDTYGADYIYRRDDGTSAPTFGPEQAAKYDDAIEATFEVADREGFDIYELLTDLMFGEEGSEG